MREILRVILSDIMPCKIQKYRWTYVVLLAFAVMHQSIPVPPAPDGRDKKVVQMLQGSGSKMFHILRFSNYFQ